MRTMHIISESEDEPLHLRFDADLHNAPVSTRSKWGDEVWHFDSDTLGLPLSHSRCLWGIKISEVQKLTDPEFVSQLDIFRRLVWSAFADPGPDRSAFKPATLARISSSLRIFAPWFCRNGFTKFAQLDRDAIQAYVDKLQSLLAPKSDLDDDFDPEISINRAYEALLIPSLIWEQREPLKLAGLAPMPDYPWGNGTRNSVAHAIGVKTTVGISPVPDEVAIPVLSAAHRFLGVPTDDVLQVLQIYVESCQNPQQFGLISQEAALCGAAIKGFVFKTIPGENKPWREPLTSTRSANARCRAPKDSIIGELRQLTRDVIGAAGIVIQASTGMRSSEVCGITGGCEAFQTVPACISWEESPSGLYEIFEVEGFLSKGETNPILEKWAIGLRVIDDPEFPPAVHAAKILDRLLSPWRDAGLAADLLFAKFPQGPGLFVPQVSDTGLQNYFVCDLAQDLKHFVFRYVDLSDLPDTSERAISPGDLIKYRESRGTCLRPYQWRFTFAHFVNDCDPSLPPALMEQFKHANFAMTTDVYLRTNKQLYDLVDTARAQETALTLYEMVNGAPLIGRMGHRIEERIEEFKAKLGETTSENMWRQIVSYVVDNNLRIFFTNFGGCLPLVTSEMRCRQKSGTLDWRNTLPDFSTREPSTCAGCANYLANLKHEDFWFTRLLQNERAYREASTNTSANATEIFRARADQAKAVLMQYGYNQADLEQFVDENV